MNRMQQSMMGGNNFGMSGFPGGMMPGGGFDPRQSMAGSFMGGGPGMMTYNRGDGMNLNPPYMPPRTQIGDVRELKEHQLRQIYKIRRVEPMVEVRVVYNDELEVIRTTMCAEGDFPEWNEILEFPLKSLNQKRFTR